MSMEDCKNDLIPLQLIIVGDGNVGKTALLYSYVNNVFLTEIPATVFDQATKNVIVNGTPFSLTVWDTAGSESYNQVRPLSYPDTDCFLVCFSIDCPDSLGNVERKWIPEIRYYCPTTPFILVGTKGDLRSDTKLKTSCVTPNTARKLKERIKAGAFVECSANTQQNLHKVFDEAVKAAMFMRNSDKKQTRSVCIFVIYISGDLLNLVFLEIGFFL